MRQTGGRFLHNEGGGGGLEGARGHFLPPETKRIQDTMAQVDGILPELLNLSLEDRALVLEELAEDERAALALALRYRWRLWARPLRELRDGRYGGQLEPPGDWRYWVVCAGRGYGKTRTGAEWVREKAESGRYRWITIVGPTREALRKILLRGPAGLLTISPPWFAPKYEPSKLLLTWPNGCQARLYSAEKPERLRGEQHECVWMDELGAWPKQEAFEQIDLGLRLGPKPQALITTTPRPIRTIMDLVLGPRKPDGSRTRRRDVAVTIGRTDENADNLSPGFADTIRARLGESPLARQELDAELLEAPEGALWSADLLDACRCEGVPTTIRRCLVAVDPTRAGDPIDECGIVVAGLADDGHAYVLADASLHGTPLTWVTAACETYRYYRADAMVYEMNGLGKEVESGLKAFDSAIKWTPVNARDQKHARAAPVARLYELGKVHHVGTFPQMEDELVTFDPRNTRLPSPNRMDALVWALTELMLDSQRPPLIAR